MNVQEMRSPAVRNSKRMTSAASHHLHLQNKALSYQVVHTQSTCTLNYIHNIYIIYVKTFDNGNKLKEPEKLGEKSVNE